MHFSLRKSVRKAVNSGTRASKDVSSTSSINSADSNSLNNDISSTAYARRRRELFKVAQALRNLGADSVLSIPRVAVIGGQSAGKSSLVEAVTGIKVPRDDGTCTRCPMECTVSSFTSTWSCQVSLRFQFDANGEEIKLARPIPFGNKLVDKNDVEIQIRRAQAAILSPHRSHDSFLNYTYEQARGLAKIDPKTLSFSKNAVVVDIEDPEGTDLLFVDLPGLIQNARNDTDIRVVRELVEGYIGREKTIILATVPASDDLENQQAIKLARDADSAGDRTIAIITKPDTVPEGATGKRQRWRDLLKGTISEHALKFGYYCVRLPDDSDRAKGVTREKMEHIASEFFQKTKPWSEVPQSRLGIQNLVTSVSKLFMDILERDLPGIREQVRQLLEECEEDLGKLPAPITGNPTAELLNRVTGFCRELQNTIGGRADDKSFVHRNRAVYGMFRVAIWKTAPDFRPFEDFSGYTIPPLPNSIKEEYRPEAKSLKLARSTKEQKPMGLYDVRRVIQDSTGWELPRNIPYDAKKRLIKDFLDMWHEPAQACFKDILGILSETVDRSISEYYQEFKPLQNHIRPIVREFLTQVSDTAAEHLKQVLKRENDPYYTQNLHYLNSVYGVLFAHYKLIRRNAYDYRIRRAEFEECSRSVSPCSDISHVSPHSSAPKVSYSDVPTASSPRVYSYVAQKVEETPEQAALRALARVGYRDLAVADLVRLLPPDAFEDELAVMADVRAYFQVAFKRIIDHVPTTIEHSLNQTLVDNLQGYLIKELGFGSNDASQKFADLLAEDAQVRDERARLAERKTQLLAIQKELSRFEIEG